MLLIERILTSNLTFRLDRCHKYTIKVFLYTILQRNVLVSNKISGSGGTERDLEWEQAVTDRKQFLLHNTIIHVPVYMQR